jgi:hypothetical protein
VAYIALRVFGIAPGCSVALGCGIAQLVVRPYAARKARVRFSAWHTWEVFLSEMTSDEDIERNLGD